MASLAALDRLLVQPLRAYARRTGRAGGLSTVDDHRRGRPGQRGGHRVQPADRLVVRGRPRPPRSAVRRQDRVGDQHRRALEVVEHDQVGGQHHAELGHVQVVGGELGQPLEPAHDVVGEEADQATGQRRQRHSPVAGWPTPDSSRDGLPQHRRPGRRSVGTPAGGVPSQRACAVALGQGGGAAHADERVPRPGRAARAAPCSADSSRKVPGPPASLR